MPFEVIAGVSGPNTETPLRGERMQNKTKLQLKLGEKGRLSVEATVVVDESTAGWFCATPAVLAVPNSSKTPFDIQVVGAAVGMAIFDFSVVDANGAKHVHSFEVTVSDDAIESSLIGRARVSRDSFVAGDGETVLSESKSEEVEIPGICGLCGLPLPEGEETFKYHGYSGQCPTVASGEIVGDAKPNVPETLIEKEPFVAGPANEFARTEFDEKNPFKPLVETEGDREPFKVSASEVGSLPEGLPSTGAVNEPIKPADPVIEGNKEAEAK